MRLRFPAPQRPICLTRISLLAPLRGAFRKLRRFWLSPKTAFVCSNRPASFLAARPPPLLPCFVYGNNYYFVQKLPYGMRLRFPAPQRPICLTRISLLVPLPAHHPYYPVLCMAIISPFQRYKYMRRFAVFIIMLCGLWSVALLAVIIVCGMCLREHTTWRVSQIIRNK